VARRARRERAYFPVKIFSSHLAPLGCCPCVRRTRHPFAASGLGASQNTEFVFSASLETVGGEPKEKFDFHHSLGQGGTWQPARFTILRFSLRMLVSRQASETSFAVLLNRATMVCLPQSLYGLPVNHPGCSLLRSDNDASAWSLASTVITVTHSRIKIRGVP
jgi:hypothetical protein